MSVTIAPELAQMGKLCPQEEVIMTKFNQLLAKLRSNYEARNASDQAALATEEKAIQDWLNVESEYRLASGKAEKSKEGTGYAQGQYEKWNALLIATKEREAQEAKDHAPKQAEIDEERALIKELLALIEELYSSEVMKTNGQAILKQFNQKVGLCTLWFACLSCHDCLARTTVTYLCDTRFCRSFSSSSRRPGTEVVSDWLRWDSVMTHECMHMHACVHPCCL